MEKHVSLIIDSYLNDLNPKKLDLLNDFLLGLLFKKELLVYQNKSGRDTKKIDRLLKIISGIKSSFLKN